VKTNIQVLKFGGSSVAVAAHWQTIVERVTHELDNKQRVLLVLSALKNVSNLLEALLHQAKAGVYQQPIEHLRQLHLALAQDLGVDGESLLHTEFQQLHDLCQQIFEQQRIQPEMHAKVLAFGEILSSKLGHAFLQQQGIDAEWIDARRHLVARQRPHAIGHFLSNECDWRYDAKRDSGLVEGSLVKVTQGFIAADAEGKTVLLGREGSDTSAAYFAAMLNAQTLQIWTDVPGIFSFNPHQLNEARRIAEMSIVQARQLAELGAKVLHPKAIKPIADSQIQLQIRSTQQPEAGMTRVSNLSSDKVLPVGMAQLDGLMWLRSWRNDHQWLQKLRQQLIELGFELVLLHASNKEQHWLFSYTNSDAPMPDKEALASALSLDECEVEITSGATALSVVGFGSEWFETLKQEIESYFAKPLHYSILEAPDSSRISVIFDNQNAADAHQLAVRLHSRMMELNPQLASAQSWRELITKE